MNLSLSEVADEVSIDTALDELLLWFTDKRSKVLRDALVRCKVPKPGLDLYNRQTLHHRCWSCKEVSPHPHTHTTQQVTSLGPPGWHLNSNRKTYSQYYPVPIPLNVLLLPLCVEMSGFCLQATGRASHSDFDSRTIMGRWQLPPSIALPNSLTDLPCRESLQVVVCQMQDP